MEHKKQVIVLSLPGVSDEKYSIDIKNIADICIEMDKQTQGRDHLFILHDKSGGHYLNHHEFTNAHLIEVDPSLDMWMRDYPPTIPDVQVRFQYHPGYLQPSRANIDVNGFDIFAEKVKLPYFDHCDIVLEGGNIVDNGNDIAIITTRVFKENKDVSEAEMKDKLEPAIKRKVLFIPDPVTKTTGHADGVVSFVEEDVVLVAYYEDDIKYYTMVEEEIRKTLPGTKIIPLPCYTSNDTTQCEFGSAEGSYANALVTYNAVYVPMFSNHASNQKALEVFQANTKKEVVPVYGMDKVAALGGSIRCMTWQIDQNHPIAQRLFDYVKGRGSGGDEEGNL